MSSFDLFCTKYCSQIYRKMCSFVTPCFDDVDDDAKVYLYFHGIRIKFNSVTFLIELNFIQV